MADSTQTPDSRLGASVEKLKKEFETWIDAAVSQGGRALDAFGLRGGERNWIPLIDVVETSDAVLVYIDLPGVDPRSVDVTLTGNMLTVKGERGAIATGEGSTLHSRERTCGPFQRSIPLPAVVDADTVQAEAKDGVIRLRCSKPTPTRARQITINMPQ